MATISARSAIINDLNTLLEFEQNLIDAERPLDPFLNTGDLFYYNIPHLISDENTNLIVVENEKEVVGCGYARIEKAKQYHKNPLHGYIGFIFVKPNFRGKRISNTILEHLKSWAKKKGLNELRLDVYNNNSSAIKSYERFGFNKSMMNMRMEI